MSPSPSRNGGVAETIHLITHHSPPEWSNSCVTAPRDAQRTADTRDSRAAVRVPPPSKQQDFSSLHFHPLGGTYGFTDGVLEDHASGPASCVCGGLFEHRHHPGQHELDVQGERGDVFRRDVRARLLQRANSRTAVRCQWRRVQGRRGLLRSTAVADSLSWRPPRWIPIAAAPLPACYCPR
jgi:hypothetical protein